MTFLFYNYRENQGLPPPQIKMIARRVLEKGLKKAVPWRCHRSLIADALTVQGWQVLDIISDNAASPHKLTPFLKVEDGRLTYPEVES